MRPSPGRSTRWEGFGRRFSMQVMPLRRAMGPRCGCAGCSTSRRSSSTLWFRNHDGSCRNLDSGCTAVAGWMMLTSGRSSILRRNRHECGSKKLYSTLATPRRRRRPSISCSRATQRRLTTADRLRFSLQRRPRHRWRALLLDVLSDVEDGVTSPLERRYRRDVEHGHGLPAGARNQGEARPGGGRWYRDVRYRPWRVIVELDGRAAHPMDRAFRDMRRDNIAALAARPRSGTAGVTWPVTHAAWPRR